MGIAGTCLRGGGGVTDPVKRSSGLSAAGVPKESSTLPVPDELLQLLLVRTGDKELLALRLASRLFCALVDDDGVWRPRAEAAWRDKVGGILLERWLQVSPVRDAYRGALHDAVRRDLSEKELAAQPFWCFRFKAAAGGSWIAQDPWWRGKPAIRLCLARTGDVIALNDARPFWGPKGTVGGQWRVTGYDEARGGAAVLEMNGHPPYVVCRHAPNWGVYMQSCWCLWTAFEMPPHGTCPELEDEALAALGVTADDPVQQRAVARYNASVASGSY
eukprot:gnl/TRDRNA2_/TRDRNA2_202358_c0_seq1.p1 gnl/TRDRNA2_/TRDRNA2_202358_c0~~gnl/TRDRNA2_/TRDRNA2_202358_c0_seq1.p1  ORF type:complete len:274 (-),score=44.20 gnl/TRDRNA2_/TRDRNA2_202358_c0_seq1:64-885(-)